LPHGEYEEVPNLWEEKKEIESGFLKNEADRAWPNKVQPPGWDGKLYCKREYSYTPSDGSWQFFLKRNVPKKSRGYGV